MRDSIDWNPNFFKQLGQHPGVELALKKAADKVVKRARQTAPVETGEYRDGIKAEVRRRKTGRSVGVVVFEDKKSLLVEYHTGNAIEALYATSKRARK